MGLTGFYPLLKTHGCYTPSTVSLADLDGKTVAIDGDFMMYIALHGYTTGTVVTAGEIAAPIMRWLERARVAGIQTIFVTTGGPSPLEKQAHCGVLRTLKRARQNERIEELRTSLASAVARDDDIGRELYLRDQIDRLQNTVRCISATMSKSVVEILVGTGWNCMSAKSEADFLLVLLSEDHKCDYVATDDADIIVAGAEHVLRGFVRLLTDPTAVGTVFCRSTIMTCLQLTSAALLQLGSLLACDYQPPITNVGPVTAFRMIQKYGTVDNFLRSEAFTCETKSKKRKYSLPPGMSLDAYSSSSSRSVTIFCSRPDKDVDLKIHDDKVI